MITCSRCEGCGSVGVFRSMPAVLRALLPGMRIGVAMAVPVLEAQRLLAGFSGTGVADVCVSSLASAVVPVACPGCEGAGQVEPYDGREYSIAPVEIDRDGCARSRESIQRAETERHGTDDRRRMPWSVSV